MGGELGGVLGRQGGNLFADVRSGAEEHHHAVFFPSAFLHCPPRVYWVLSVHQRMRKAHFGAIDGTAAGGLDDGQPVMIFRVEDDALGGNLLSRTRSEMPPAWLEGLLTATVDSNRTFRVSSAADMVPRQFGVMSGDGGKGGTMQRCDRRASVRVGARRARGTKRRFLPHRGTGSSIGARLTARMRRMG